MMNKRKLLTFLAAAFFFCGMIGTIFVLRPSQSRKAEIVQDGTVLYTIDLDKAENREIVIVSENGSTNTVTIRDGTIFVSQADCPDQICVKTGSLRSEYLPIVCLPNKLIIRFC